MTSRVNSEFRLLAFGFQPVGAVLSGILITAVGAKQTVLIFFVVGIGLARATTSNSRVRHARPVVKEAATPA